jgi:hypothetical protein
MAYFNWIRMRRLRFTDTKRLQPRASGIGDHVRLDIPLFFLSLRIYHYNYASRELLD